MDAQCISIVCFLSMRTICCYPLLKRKTGEFKNVLPSIVVELVGVDALILLDDVVESDLSRDFTV